MTTPGKHEAAVERLAASLVSVPILAGWTSWWREALARAVLASGVVVPAAEPDGLTEDLADWLGAMPEASNVFDITDEATTVISIDVETLAQRIAARAPAREAGEVGDMEALLDRRAQSWRTAALEQAAARDGLAERALIERTIRRVFEHARENTDEIEGGQVPGAGWLHTSAAIDQWLRDRLEFELSETGPALLAEGAADGCGICGGSLAAVGTSRCYEAHGIATGVACAVLHRDAEGRAIPCPGYPHVATEGGEGRG